MERAISWAEFFEGEDAIGVIEAHVHGLPDGGELMGGDFRIEVGGMVWLIMGGA